MRTGNLHRRIERLEQARRRRDEPPQGGWLPVCGCFKTDDEGCPIYVELETWEILNRGAVGESTAAFALRIHPPGSLAGEWRIVGTDVHSDGDEEN